VSPISLLTSDPHLAHSLLALDHQSSGRESIPSFIVPVAFDSRLASSICYLVRLACCSPSSQQYPGSKLSVQHERIHLVQSSTRPSRPSSTAAEVPVRNRRPTASLRGRKGRKRDRNKKNTTPKQHLTVRSTIASVLDLFSASTFYRFSLLWIGKEKKKKEKKKKKKTLRYN
jgi:hypothetical protein